MRRKSVSVLVIAAVASWLTGHLASSSAAAESVSTAYAMPIDVGFLSGHISFAHDINDLGQVVGGAEESTFPERQHALLWDPVGGVTDLGALGGTLLAGTVASAHGINNSGQVVGESTTSAGEHHAFLWTAVDGMTDLGTFGGIGSSADDINNGGQIVGSYVTADGLGHAFLWNPIGGMTDLGTLGGAFGSRASAINDSGQVVGSSWTSSDEQHAFLWDPVDGMSDLGTLGGRSSGANDINNNGQIVGAAETPALTFHAVMWSPSGAKTDLGTLDERTPGGSTRRSESFGNGINDAGQIVGQSSTDKQWSRDAFLWDPVRGMIDLGALTPPAYFVPDSDAEAINSLGQITGDHGTTALPYRAVMWSPAEHPSVSVGSASVVEGDGNKRTVQFAVTLSEPSIVPISVDYSIQANGSATPSTDFVVKSGTLTLRPAAKTGFFTSAVGYVTATVNPDVAVEGEETFEIVLSKPSAGYKLGRSVGVGTIIDDDGGVGLRVGVGDTSVLEGNAGAGKVVRTRVALSAPAASQVTVQLTLTPVTTTPGLDHQAVKATKTLTFKAGQWQKVVSLKVYPDILVEGDETFSIALWNPSTGLSIDRSVGTITIIDDD